MTSHHIHLRVACRKTGVFALLITGGLLLSGCTGNPMRPVESTDMIEPGRGTDDYKLSPCACIEVPDAPIDERFLRLLESIHGSAS